MKLILNQEEEQFRVLYLSGGDYEQGVQHGRAAKRLIWKNLEETEQWISQAFPGGAEQLQPYYRANHQFLERHRPELLEELRGLADGSGLPLASILLLNIQIYFTLRWIVPECSQFCTVLRGADGSTKTLAGKTRDNSAGPRETVMLLRNYPDGLRMIEVGFAGIVTGPGNVLTNRGISVTSSGVWSPRLPVHPEDFSRGEVLPDTHRLARMVHSLSDAETYLKHLPRASGMNYIISAPGHCTLVSMTAREVYMKYSETGLCATNHYPFEGWQPLSYTQEEYASTHCRFRRIAQLLPRAGDERACWEILSDHKDFPQNSVCRHGVHPGESWTTYGALSSLEAETMYVAIHNPCLVPSVRLGQGIEFLL